MCISPCCVYYSVVEEISHLTELYVIAPVVKQELNTELMWRVVENVLKIPILTLHSALFNYRSYLLTTGAINTDPYSVKSRRQYCKRYYTVKRTFIKF
jgi:hypothetical protein